MTRADEIRAAHARHRDRRTVECAECVLLDEIDVLTAERDLSRRLADALREDNARLRGAR